MIEEIIVRQKRNSLEHFAEHQRLLKALDADKSSGFRHRLAVVLMNAAKRLEPALITEPIPSKC
jgi:hypothetical protein